MSNQQNIDSAGDDDASLHLGSLAIETENNLTEWTDDLPVCRLSGVGSSTNQVYREDGIRREGHEFEDRSFHFSVDNNVFLYGVFDGHSSSKVSVYVAQNIPAELLLDQLKDKATDREVKEVLYQAFVSVENGFSQLIDGVLAERLTLQQLRLQTGSIQYEQKHSDILKRLQSIDSQLNSGTTALVALIVNNKLYVANIGCSRALLVKKDVDGRLHVTQLTNDHDLTNQNELDRLSSIGLDAEKLRSAGQLGGHRYTRSIGDHYIKHNYQEIESLRLARSTALIAEPEISDGFELNDSCSFLVLMSDGLYKSLMDSGITEQVNVAITRMIAQQLAVQTTLNGVAQAVVDQAVRIHHDTFMTATDPQRRQICQKRDDITLVIRSFDYSLPNALIGSPNSGIGFCPGLPPQTIMNPLSLIIPSEKGQSHEESSQFSRAFFNVTRSGEDESERSTLNSTNDSLVSRDEGSFKHNSMKQNQLPLDVHGKIEAYVQFNEFFKALEELTDAQRESLDAETEPKPDFETIPEEK